jgi:riboflavin synthase
VTAAGFKDHFSTASDRYAAHRPDYPPELFDWLASLCPQHDLAWDCATGNGQAALGLTTHFRRIVASDASAAQIRHAQSPPADRLPRRAGRSQRPRRGQRRSGHGRAGGALVRPAGVLRRSAARAQARRGAGNLAGFSRVPETPTMCGLSTPSALYRMFTGIIQAIGRIHEYEARGADARMVITGGGLDFSDVALGDSIAVNGVCLTAVALGPDSFTVDVSAETLRVTEGFTPGAEVNLEKALRLADRLGGHLVSGHVDGVGTVHRFAPVGESFLLEIDAPRELARYIIRKGSITVNGVSLTVNAVEGCALCAEPDPAHPGNDHTQAPADRQPGQPGSRHDRALRRAHDAIHEHNGQRLMSLASTLEIIEELKAGRMVVLVDEEDRENEGDLVMAAEHVTPDAINFMAKYGRGLICLTLTDERCRQLGLKQMVRQPDAARHRVHHLDRGRRGRDHRHFAADRAVTIQAAVKKDALPPTSSSPATSSRCARSPAAC